MGKMLLQALCKVVLKNNAAVVIAYVTGSVVFENFLHTAACPPRGPSFADDGLVVQMGGGRGCDLGEREQEFGR